MVIAGEEQKESVPAKQWFLIKGPDEPQWIAYKLSSAEVASVLPNFQIRGPFKSFFHCMFPPES